MREQLKRVPGVVGAVRSLRIAASRARRAKTIEAYLRAHSVRKLQLGVGDNVLDGWLNADISVYRRNGDVVYLDAREPFPLPDGSFDKIFSEHMLEHLTYADGVRCLAECHRVLRSGGRIRIATPSLDRLVRLYDADLGDVERRYIRWAVDSFVPDADAYLPGFVVNNFLHDWEHRFIYDTQTLRHALERSGFVDVQECAVGQSDDAELAGLERHLQDAPEFNELETMVFEARRS